MKSTSITRLSPQAVAGRPLTLLLSLIVVSMIGFTAWQLNQQYRLSAPLFTRAFLLGTLLAIVYRIANPLAWVWVLRSMGQSVAPVAATKTWLIAESRRWLPGGIWAYASRTVAAGELGVSKTVAATSMAVELLLTIAAAIIVSMAVMVMHFEELCGAIDLLLAHISVDRKLVYSGVVTALMGVIGVYCLRRPLWKKAMAVNQEIVGLRGANISITDAGRAFGYLVFLAIMNGLVNSLILPAVDSGHVPVTAMVAATAIAWLVGLFALCSPGGILAREAALATLLLPWLSWETGFTLAVLSRFAQLIAEVVGMIIAASGGLDSLADRKVWPGKRISKVKNWYLSSN